MAIKAAAVTTLALFGSSPAPLTRPQAERAATAYATRTASEIDTQTRVARVRCPYRQSHTALDCLIRYRNAPGPFGSRGKVLEGVRVRRTAHGITIKSDLFQ